MIVALLAMVTGACASTTTTTQFLSDPRKIFLPDPP
jgi:hypothetical protein